MPEISVFFPQWSWSGVCTLNSSLPESRWSHPRSCRTNRRSPCGPERNTSTWIRSAGICPLKFCPPTRPWRPTCPTSRGPIVLISDWRMREGHVVFLFSRWEMLQSCTLKRTNQRLLWMFKEFRYRQQCTSKVCSLCFLFFKCIFFIYFLFQTLLFSRCNVELEQRLYSDVNITGGKLN